MKKIILPVILLSLSLLFSCETEYIEKEGIYIYDEYCLSIKYRLEDYYGDYRAYEGQYGTACKYVIKKYYNEWDIYDNVGYKRLYKIKEHYGEHKIYEYDYLFNNLIYTVKKNTSGKYYLK